MAAQQPVIDLTGSDDESVNGKDECRNPNHAHALNSMRKQLYEKEKASRQVEAKHEQEMIAKDVNLAERQARIVDLATRDADRVAEITRLQAELDTLKDRLANRGKRQKRVRTFTHSTEPPPTSEAEPLC